MSRGAPQPSDHERLRALLRDRLHLRAEPLSLIGPVTIPAASLWNGTRCWVEALRSAPVRHGDTVVVHPGHQVALVQVLLAGLWCGLHLELSTAALSTFPDPEAAPDPAPVAGSVPAAVSIDLRIAQGLAGPSAAATAAWPDRSVGPTAGPERARPTAGPQRAGPTAPTLRQGGPAPRLIDAATVLDAVGAADAAHFRDAVVFVAATDVALATVFDHVLVPLLVGATAVVWPGPDELRRHGASLIARHEPDVIVPCSTSPADSCSSVAASPPICTL